MLFVIEYTDYLRHFHIDYVVKFLVNQQVIIQIPNATYYSLVLRRFQIHKYLFHDFDLPVSLFIQYVYVEVFVGTAHQSHIRVKYEVLLLCYLQFKLTDKRTDTRTEIGHIYLYRTLIKSLLGVILR